MGVVDDYVRGVTDYVRGVTDYVLGVTYNICGVILTYIPPIQSCKINKIIKCNQTYGGGSDYVQMYVGRNVR